MIPGGILWGAAMLPPLWPKGFSPLASKCAPSEHDWSCALVASMGVLRAVEVVQGLLGPQKASGRLETVYFYLPEAVEDLLRATEATSDYHNILWT